MIFSEQSPRYPMALCLMLIACLLGGCGIGTTTATISSAPEVGPALTGGIHGGQQPVSGASVYLYAASTSGYANAATSLLCGSHTTVTCNSPSASVLADASGNGYVVSDANGGFNITGDYSCPANSQVYLIAMGGNPGLTGTVNNTGLGLMGALGSCATLSANAGTQFLNINELTTIASVYALAPFMSSPTNVGTSSTNTQGLDNAFGTVYNLVNYASGSAPGIGQPVAGGSPAGLPEGLTVPVAELNTLGNILASCVNSSSASSTTCSALFTNATAPSGTAPTNTIQAALNIAQNPGQNVAALFGLAGSSVPFQTALTNAPQDWTLGIVYAGPKATPINNTSSYQIAVDAAGNVYAPQNSANYLIKVTPAGVVSAIGNGITTPNIPLAGSYAVAVDLNGNLWVTNTTSGKEALTELDENGNLLAQATPTSAGGTSNGGMTSGSAPALIAIDGNNNIWFTNLTTVVPSVSKFNSSATAISPTTGYVGIMTAGSDRPLGIAIDSSNNAWAGIQKGAHANEVLSFSASTGAALPGTPYLTTNSPVSNSYALTFDGLSNIWIASRNNYSIVGIASATGSLVGSEPTGGYTGGGQASGATNSIAVDGNNNVWVANDTANNVSELITVGPNAGTFASPVGTGTAPTGGFQHGAIAGNRSVAIDGSGNVWTNGNAAILEIVGAAAPVLTPLAQAVKSNKLGQRP